MSVAILDKQAITLKINPSVRVCFQGDNKFIVIKNSYQ